MNNTATQLKEITKIKGIFLAKMVMRDNPSS